jgi:hypothetical protein
MLEPKSGSVSAKGSVARVRPKLLDTRIGLAVRLVAERKLELSSSNGSGLIWERYLAGYVQRGWI